MTESEARAALAAILARTPLHQAIVVPRTVALAVLGEKGEVDAD